MCCVHVMEHEIWLRTSMSLPEQVTTRKTQLTDLDQWPEVERLGGSRETSHRQSRRTLGHPDTQNLESVRTTQRRQSYVAVFYPRT